MLAAVFAATGISSYAAVGNDAARDGDIAEEEARDLWVSLTRERRFAELAEKIPLYLASLPDGTADGDGKTLDEEVLFARANLAQAYLFMEDFGRCEEELSRIGKVLPQVSDYHIGLIFHNVSAILCLKRELNYSKALYHLNEAVDCAGEAGDSLALCPLLCNMVSIYYEREDAAGMPLAIRAYRIAKAENDTNNMFYGAVMAAQMGIVAGDYRIAEAYADSASRYAPSRKNSSQEALLQLLHGEIYYAMGDYARADSAYSCFASRLDSQEPGLRLEYMYKQGCLELAWGNPEKARRLFEDGLALSYSIDNIEDRHHFLSGLSDFYSSVGDDRTALSYYKEYHHLLDSLSLLTKERDFHNLLMNYQKMGYEEKVHRQEMENERVRSKYVIIFSAFILVSSLSAGLWFLYRRRNRMYRQLVEQHQRFLHRAEISACEAAVGPGTEDNEKSRSLFMDAEKIMSRDKIYRQNDLSLEKLADILQSNRSYVSSAINQYSGMSFTQWLNSWRIKEAIARLSDPADTAPLKAISDEVGFNTIAVFYKAFQKETGCPPAKYRKEMRNIGHIPY